MWNKYKVNMRFSNRVVERGGMASRNVLQLNGVG